MWFCYIIYSKTIDKYHIGYTDDLDWRLKRHNQGWGRFTKRGIPWKLAQLVKFNLFDLIVKRGKKISSLFTIFFR